MKFPSLELITDDLKHEINKGEYNYFEKKLLNIARNCIQYIIKEEK